MMQENMDNREFVKQSEKSDKPFEDENFFTNAAARFTEAVLTITTGIAVYKVKPTKKSEENQDLRLD